MHERNPVRFGLGTASAVASILQGLVPVRMLFVSNLFPNSVDPSRGLFSYNQLKALREIGCDFKVIAPVARFPFIRSRWATERSRLPYREQIDGFDVYHPKAWYLPRSRGAQNAYLYRWSIRKTADRLLAQQRPQALWASFAFPDGVASTGIARRHRLPLVVSLLGSDINLNLRSSGRRRAITGSLQQAALILAKSRALKDIVVGLGVSAERVVLDYNGVDQDMFAAVPREEACRACGVDPAGRRVLFVGNFVDVKDIPTLVRAFATVVKGRAEAEVLDLVLIGDGPKRDDLLALAGSLGVRARVHMPGAMAQGRVAAWMAASDVLCLPSTNEGVPNVVLEGFASGIPVVASNVGGIPEIHPGDEFGALFEPGDHEALAAKLREVLGRQWNRDALVEHVSAFSWRRNADNVLDALRGLEPSAALECS